MDCKDFLSFFVTNFCTGIVALGAAYALLASQPLNRIYGKYPTERFTILKPQNPTVNKVYVIQKRRSTDLEGSVI